MFRAWIFISGIASTLEPVQGFYVRLGSEN